MTKQDGRNKRLTNYGTNKYNKGIPIKCTYCNKTIAYYKGGNIYIKCSLCRKENNASHYAELKAKELEAAED